MGHKWYGTLPKTKAWRLIVDELAAFSHDDMTVSEIAKRTLAKVYNRFDSLPYDPSFRETFETLLKISFAFQLKEPVKNLVDNNILNDPKLTILKIVSAIVNKKPDKKIASGEYHTLAKQAAVDAINQWYANNIERGHTLFSDSIETENIFYKISDGRGFCELSRLYFSKYTERYLKYFLEREASSVIPDIIRRNKFNEELSAHIKDISQHAFETAKITESYSAGWYNKYAIGRYPAKDKIDKYITKTFGKMRKELLEETGK